MKVYKGIATYWFRALKLRYVVQKCLRLWFKNWFK